MAREKLQHTAPGAIPLLPIAAVQWLIQRLHMDSAEEQGEGRAVLFGRNVIVYLMSFDNDPAHG